MLDGGTVELKAAVSGKTKYGKRTIGEVVDCWIHRVKRISGGKK
jgi:hypothetical protein